MSNVIDAFEAGELLASLVDKSLIVFDEVSGRYRMLETVRQYARDRLLEGADGKQWRDRHLVHFLALVEEAEPHLTGAGEAEWLNRLDTEYDNLRAALEWCALSENGGEPGLRLCGALGQFWFVRGHFGEARERCAAALAHPGASKRTRTRAKALRVAGSRAVEQGHHEEARALLEEAMEIQLDSGDRYGESITLCMLGRVASSQRDYARAKPLYEQSLAVMKEIGNREWEAFPTANLGGIAEEQGELEEARRLHQEALEIFREVGILSGEAKTLLNLGMVARRNGDLSLATTLYGQALSIAARMRTPHQVAYCLYEFGICSEQAGQLHRAVRLLAAADALRSAIGAPFKAYDRNIIDLALARLCTLLPEEAFTAAVQEGSGLTMEQAIELALEAREA